MLDQLILEPTRITETQANILDLLFTNNEALVNQVRIIPGISDHESDFIESSLRPMKNNILPYKEWQYVRLTNHVSSVLVDASNLLNSCWY